MIRGLATPGRLALVTTLVVFALAWLFFELAHPPTPLHADTFEDMLRARACAEDGRCETVGVRSSFAPIFHGGLWVQLLAALLQASTSIAWIHSFTFVLAALGVALVHASLRDRPRVAGGAAAIACLFILWSGSLHVPWNPSLVPLPAALVVVTAHGLVTRRGRVDVVMLGLALGLLLESHPVAALVAPGALLLAGVSQRDRASAFLAPWVAGALATGLYLGISPAAALANAYAVVRWLGGPWPLVGAGVAIGVLAVALGPAFGRRSRDARRVLASAALVLPVTVASLLRAAVDPDAPTGGRYLLPAVFGFAHLGAELARPLVRRSPAAALGLAVVLALPLIENEEPVIRLASLERAREDLEARGQGLDEAYAHVSGPRCLELLGGLAAVGLEARGPVEPTSNAWIIAPVIDLERAGIEDLSRLRGRWRRIEARVGDLALGEVDTWVRRDHFRACMFHSGASEPTCVESSLADGVGPRSVDDVRGRLARPRIAWAGDERRTDRIRYRFDVRVPPGEGARRVVVAEAADYACREIRFTDSEDLALVGGESERAVRIERRAAPQRGHLELEMAMGSCQDRSLELFPPCLAEIDDGDPPGYARLVGGAQVP